MMVMHESPPPLAEQDRIAVQGGAAYVTDFKGLLAPYSARAAPQQRAMAYLRGLLRPATRKQRWSLSDASGDATPYGVQHLLRRALWDADTIHDELRTSIMHHLGDGDAVLVIDETGFLNKGRHSDGVAPQYRGTAGRLENCQIGVLLAYASRLGHALVDREFSLPAAWTHDHARCRQAGIPEARHVATKPQLTQAMLHRALVAGMPARWVTGDSVDGDDPRLRMWWESQPQASVLVVSGKAYVWLDRQPRRVHTIWYRHITLAMWAYALPTVRVCLQIVGRWSTGYPDDPLNLTPVHQEAPHGP